MRLSYVTRPDGNNQAVVEGLITPRGFELEFVDEPVLIKAFRRMIRELAYDISEMAITTYLCARAHGTPITALPIFLVRGLHHGAIVAPPNRVSEPRQLEGKRVGVSRGYTVTTGVWARAALATDFGVDLRSIDWVRSSDEHVVDYMPPPNVDDLPADSDLVELTVSGQLEAIVGAVADARLEPVIPDNHKRAIDWVRSKGIYPINHLIVVKDDVLASSPFIAQELCTMFAEAKVRYVDRLRGSPPTAPTPSESLHLEMDALLDDPLPYGIEPNRSTLEAIIAHASDQGIIPERFEPAAAFHPGTIDWAG
jgi:4,5-dihydroxyphthalate decarboxylase